MAISDKTRKILWANSGNRCAKCHQELILLDARSNLENLSIVGDECHIHSKSSNDGPRYAPAICIDLDGYHNLILLCKVCHKQIDDLPHIYTAQWLKDLKRSHEHAVKTLSKNQVVSDRATFKILLRIDSGQKLVNLVIRKWSLLILQPEYKSQNEIELAGTFLDEISEMIDYLNDLSPRGIAQISFDLNERLEMLEASGFRVFGAEVHDTDDINEKVKGIPTAMIQILRIEELETDEWKATVAEIEKAMQKIRQESSQ